jgi:lysophospholipase L1-like esterase
MQRSDAESTLDPRSPALTMLARAALVLAIVLALLVVCEGLVRRFAAQTGLFQRSVDIQSPVGLYAKIADFQARPGKKVVIMGDSLIYGQTMARHGDAAWQENTLARQLVAKLRERLPGGPIEILDLGMNGALPTDLAELSRIVGAIKPDLLIFDLTLRSFSRDFRAPDAVRTRPWLAETSIDAAGFRLAGGSPLDSWFRQWAANHSALYRLRDFGQSLVFGGQPATYILGQRNALDAWMGGSKGAAEDEDELLLLLRARARYASIDLAPDNPQRQALDRLVGQLASARQPTLVFYATESPDVRDQLVEPARFASLQAELESAVNGAGNPLLKYVGPLDVFAPANFLDHVHLDKEGYRRLSDALAAPAVQLLGSRAP